MREAAISDVEDLREGAEATGPATAKDKLGKAIEEAKSDEK